MALFPGDMNIGWGFGLVAPDDPVTADDMVNRYYQQLYSEKEEEVFDLEEKEGLLTRIDFGNRTITLDTSWLFHCSPSLMSFAGRYPVGTTLLVEYRMMSLGQRIVKSIVLRKEVEAAG